LVGSEAGRVAQRLEVEAPARKKTTSRLFREEAVNFHLAVAFSVNKGNFKKTILTDEK
jgi:hypothetical protein